MTSSQGDIDSQAAELEELAQLRERIRLLERQLSDAAARSSAEAAAQPATGIEVELLQAGKMAALGELAASVAHEFNNPLAAISAYAEQLADAAQNPALQKMAEFKKFPGHLATIRKNVKRCTEIMRTLMEFARTREDVAAAIDLRLTLQQTVALVDLEARHTGKQIELSLPDKLPPVWGQKSELQQVLLNLMTNALDASPRGGVIRVSARSEGGEVIVEFRDRGRGIPEEYRELIFSPFFTTKPPGKGTGLGLAICARIVKRMRGRIEFVTDPQEGTTFIVRLGAVPAPAGVAA